MIFPPPLMTRFILSFFELEKLELGASYCLFIIGFVMAMVVTTVGNFTDIDVIITSKDSLDKDEEKS